MDAGEISIVLPCYNPSQNWQGAVEANLLKLQSKVAVKEVIIVNDGSTNGQTTNFEKLLKNGTIKLVNYQNNRGKGYALREGVRSALSDLIIFTDIDFPYTETSFLKIYEALSNGADVAVGIRNEEYYAHMNQTRVFISKLLRGMIKFFLRIPTNDTQCGLKGFNRKGREIFLQTTINRYLFDLEFIFLSSRQRLLIKTVPVELRPEVQLTKMNWKILLQEFGNFLKIFAKSIF